MTTRLPADATKTALARAVAYQVLIWARANGGPVTRARLRDAMQEILRSPRYRDVPHPAWRTCVAAVNRLADTDDRVRLSVRHAENRI